MPIKYPQTRQDEIEVAEWMAGSGVVTRAVRRAITRTRVTFAAALITRNRSETFELN